MATMDHLLDQFEKGHIDRRQLLKGLTLIIAGASAAGVDTSVEAQGTGMLPVQQIVGHNLQTPRGLDHTGGATMVRSTRLSTPNVR